MKRNKTYKRQSYDKAPSISSSNTDASAYRSSTPMIPNIASPVDLRQNEPGEPAKKSLASEVRSLQI